MSRKRLAIAIACLVAVGLGLKLINPATAWYAPKCPFRLLTGLNCPGCGLQRLIHALLMGHPLEAIRYNYYMVFALPYAMLFGVEWVMTDGPRRERIARVIENRWMVGFYVVSFLAWLIIRNILHI